MFINFIWFRNVKKVISKVFFDVRFIEDISIIVFIIVVYVYYCEVVICIIYC